MSQNFCQESTGASLQLGRRNAGIKAISATELETRNADDNALVTLAVATPLLDTQATPKSYVDALVALNITWKQASRVCATVDITIAAPGATIDGETMVVGDRVVLKAQSTVTENGIRVWQGAAVPMTLADDWQTGSEQSGSVVSITEGTCADEMYIASADPAVVGTDDPVWLLIGTTATGVVSVADAAAVPAGGSSLIGAGPTGAVTLNVLDDSAQVSIGLAANVITLGIVANSIGTAQIAPDAVTNAELAPLAAESCILVAFDFSDAGSSIPGTAVPADSTVTRVAVRVNTAFDNTDIVVSATVNATSVTGTGDSDLFAADTYWCDNSQDLAGATSVTVGVSAGVTVGAGVVAIYYVRKS